MKWWELVISGLWALRLGANILAYAHLWYVKEYRLDRMLIHLRTDQGKRILVPPFKKPPVSPKTIVLTVLLAISEVMLFAFLPLPVIPRLVAMDLLLFPMSAALVMILRIPTVLYHEYVISKAVSLLRSHTPMTVIGITGSYGKTSTKEFLYSILSSKFKTLKTAASKNSPIGIAEVVLSGLKPDHEAFIVEMGAYKPGEVARMSSMTRPSIGIITAINAQHQDLFGSIETTKKAKYELLAALTGKRIAIVNGDLAHTREMASWAKRDKCDVWLYSAEEKPPSGAVMTADNIRVSPDEVAFDVRYAGKRKRVSAHVRGAHFVQNLLAAMASAIAAGMTFEDVCRAVGTLGLPEGAMEIRTGPDGQILINDTFNNNPDAAKAALAYLSQYKGRKILVFQPMIELGSYADVSHEDVGREAARICDGIILTNTNFSKPFIRGVRSVSPGKDVHIMSSVEAASFIRSHAAKNDAVLFKGKEAAFPLKLLTGTRTRV